MDCAGSKAPLCHSNGPRAVIEVNVEVALSVGGSCRAAIVGPRTPKT